MLLCSELVRHLDQWGLLYLDILRPVPSLCSGHYSPGPSCLNTVDLLGSQCLTTAIKKSRAPTTDSSASSF